MTKIRSFIRRLFRRPPADVGLWQFASPDAKPYVRPSIEEQVFGVHASGKPHGPLPEVSDRPGVGIADALVQTNPSMGQPPSPAALEATARDAAEYMQRYYAWLQQPPQPGDWTTGDKWYDHGGRIPGGYTLIVNDTDTPEQVEH